MIKLLDGTTHEEKDLLEKMYDDTFYYGYLGKAAFSSSTLKYLLDSPKEYYYRTKYGSSNDSSALTEGRIIHVKALEPEVFERDYQVIDVASKRTKKWTEESAASNKICLTRAEDEKTNRVVEALLKNSTFINILNKSQTEVPAIGNINGYPFRAKADILMPNGICDLKTTSNVGNFDISADKYNYDLQGYIYCTLFDVDPYDFKFFAIDKKTLDISKYHFTRRGFESGRHKLEQAIDTYENFFVGMEEEEILDALNNYIFEGVLWPED